MCRNRTPADGIPDSWDRVIFIIVHHAYSYDRFEKNQDRIFRIVSSLTHQGAYFISEYWSTIARTIGEEKIKDVGLSLRILHCLKFRRQVTGKEQKAANGGP